MPSVPRSTRFLLFAALFGVAVTTNSRRVLADPSALAQMIHGEKSLSCPAPSDVAREVWNLTPPERRSVFEQVTDIAIQDLGSSYRVVVSTRERVSERSFTGTEHDCARRARFVAVFVVLVLMPPEGLDEADAPREGVLPAPSAPVPARAVPPVATATMSKPPSPLAGLGRFPLLRLEAMLVFQNGLAAEGSDRTSGLGARLQATLGRSPLVPTFGLGYAPDIDFNAGELRAKLSRATGSLGLRARTVTSSWELGAQASAVAMLARCTGTNVASPDSGTGVEWGAELSLSAGFRASPSLQPIIALDGQWVPRPHSLVTIPSGEVGSLPSLWVDASVGFAFSP